MAEEQKMISVDHVQVKLRFGMSPIVVVVKGFGESPLMLLTNLELKKGGM